MRLIQSISTSQSSIPNPGGRWEAALVGAFVFLLPVSRPKTWAHNLRKNGLRAHFYQGSLASLA